MELQARSPSSSTSSRPQRIWAAPFPSVAFVPQTRPHGSPTGSVRRRRRSRPCLGDGSPRRMPAASLIPRTDRPRDHLTALMARVRRPGMDRPGPHVLHRSPHQLSEPLMTKRHLPRGLDDRARNALASTRPRAEGRTHCGADCHIAQRPVPGAQRRRRVECNSGRSLKTGFRALG
jgi:hypothetical protein